MDGFRYVPIHVTLPRTHVVARLRVGWLFTFLPGWLFSYMFLLLPHVAHVCYGTFVAPIPVYPLVGCWLVDGWLARTYHERCSYVWLICWTLVGYVDSCFLYAVQLVGCSRLVDTPGWLVGFYYGWTLGYVAGDCDYVTVPFVVVDYGI